MKACEICNEIGVAFVKTSTGFNKGGATVEDVALMKQTVGNIGVKASGGVRDTKTALAMIKAGATRIGASAGIAIISGAQDTQKHLLILSRVVFSPRVFTYSTISAANDPLLDNPKLPLSAVEKFVVLLVYRQWFEKLLKYDDKPVQKAQAYYSAFSRKRHLIT